MSPHDATLFQNEWEALWVREWLVTCLWSCWAGDLTVRVGASVLSEEKEENEERLSREKRRLSALCWTGEAGDEKESKSEKSAVVGRGSKILVSVEAGLGGEGWRRADR